LCFLLLDEFEPDGFRIKRGFSLNNEEGAGDAMMGRVMEGYVVIQE
jgi:hypothetical protein